MSFRHRAGSSSSRDVEADNHFPGKPNSSGGGASVVGGVVGGSASSGSGGRPAPAMSFSSVLSTCCPPRRRRRVLIWLCIAIPMYFAVLFAVWSVRRVVVDVRPNLGRVVRTNVSFIDKSLLARPECSSHEHLVPDLPRIGSAGKVVLVTGVLSSLGWGVAEHCASALEMRVIAVDKSPPPYLPSGTTFIAGDVNDPGFVVELFRTFKFSYVYHMRTPTTTDVRAFRTLVDASVTAGVQCFVFASSTLVYGSATRPSHSGRALAEAQGEPLPPTQAGVAEGLPSRLGADVTGADNAMAGIWEGPSSGLQDIKEFRRGAPAVGSAASPSSRRRLAQRQHQASREHSATSRHYLRRAAYVDGTAAPGASAAGMNAATAGAGPGAGNGRGLSGGPSSVVLGAGTGGLAGGIGGLNSRLVGSRLPESSHVAPADPVGRACATFERVLAAASNSTAMDAIVFRTHDVFGNGFTQPDASPVVEALMATVESALYSFDDGLGPRAFTYVQDVAPYIAKSTIVAGARGQVFNAGSDAVHSLRNVVDAVLASRPATQMAYIRDVDSLRHLVPAAASLPVDHSKFRCMFQIRSSTPLDTAVAKALQAAQQTLPQHCVLSTTHTMTLAEVKSQWGSFSYVRADNIFPQPPFIPLWQRTLGSRVDSRRLSPTLLAMTAINHWDKTELALDSLEKIRDDFDLLVVVDSSTKDATVAELRRRRVRFILSPPTPDGSPIGVNRLWNMAYRYFRDMGYSNVIISNNDVLVPDGAIDRVVWWLDGWRFDVTAPLSTNLGAGAHAKTQGIESLLGVTNSAEAAFVNNHLNYPAVFDRLTALYHPRSTVEELSTVPARPVGTPFGARDAATLGPALSSPATTPKFAAGLASRAGMVPVNRANHLNGFFFALSRNLQAAEHQSGDLIDPALVNVNGENDLYARLDMLGGFRLGVVRDSFVFHYKGSTLGGCTERWWNLWWALFGPRDCRDEVSFMVPRHK